MMTLQYVRPDDEAVIAACKALIAAGVHPADALIGRRVGHSASAVRTARERLRKEGRWPAYDRIVSRRMDAKERATLTRLMEENPQASHHDLVVLFEAASGRCVHHSTIQAWQEARQRKVLLALAAERPDEDPELLIAAAAAKVGRPLPKQKALDWLEDAADTGPEFGHGPVEAAYVAGCEARKAALDAKAHRNTWAHVVAPIPAAKLGLMPVSILRNLSPYELVYASYTQLRELPARHLKFMLDKDIWRNILPEHEAREARASARSALEVAIARQRTRATPKEPMPRLAETVA